MDSLPPDDLGKVPIEQIVEQINKLLAELQSRAEMNVAHDGHDADGHSHKAK